MATDPRLVRLAQLLNSLPEEQRAPFEKQLANKGIRLPDLSDPVPVYSGNPIAETAAGLGQGTLTVLGKIGDFLDTGENILMAGARPLIEGINPKIKDVYESAPESGIPGVKNVVPSDIIDTILPENMPAIPKYAIKLAADVALDPLTYVGIGELTKAGKIGAVVSSAAKAGEEIKPSSEISADIAKMLGRKKATAKLIKDAAVPLAPSLAEQARMGQRALISFGIPFTGNDLPLVKGAKIYSQLEKLGNAYKGTKVAEFVRKVFTTSSGNPEFDAMRQDLLALGKEAKYQSDVTAAGFAERIKQVSDKYKLDVGDVRKTITALAENPFYGDLSAKDVLMKNNAIIRQAALIDKRPIEKLVRDLPDFQLLPMRERERLVQYTTKMLTRAQAGYNVYTTGLRHLPPNMQQAFAEEFARVSGLNIAKGFGRAGRFKTADIGKVFSDYLNSGEEQALEQLVGRKEYGRLLTQHNQLLAVNKKLRVPEVFSEDPITEYAQAKYTLRELMSHVDQMFGATYTIYKSNPKYLQKTMGNIHTLFQKMDAKDAWKIESLIEQFKVPAEYAKKYPKLFDLAQDVRRWGQEMLQREKNAGVPTTEFIGDIPYVAHIPSQEVRQWLEKNGGSAWKGAAREWSTKHQNQFVRSIASVDEGKVNAMLGQGLIDQRHAKALLNKNGTRALDYLWDTMVPRGDISFEQANNLVHYLTVSEVNDMNKLGKLQLLGGQSFNKFFEDNPSEILRVRGGRGERAITAAQFLEASKPFGIRLRPGQIIPVGYQPVKAEALKGFAFEQGVADHIDKYYEAVKLPTAIHPFLRGYDKFQDTWKAWTLAPFPAYHTRNFIGNLWNNFLAGMTPDTWTKYGDAAKIQKGLKYSLTTASGQKFNSEQLLHLARRYGVLDTGQFYGDIEHWFEIDAKHSLGPLVRNAVIESGRNVGNWIENNAKLGHFLWQLEKGYSPLDAALSVKKYLFDYRNLSDVEKNIFRRVLPFYAWTRFNVPLQISALITNPAKIGGVFKLKNAVESNQDGLPDERLLPDWMQQNFAIRVRFNQQSQNYEYFLLNSWLPAADIDKLFDPVQFAANLLSPLLKEPIQQLTNHDIYFNKDIDSGDQYDRVAGINMKARIAHIARNIRLINEVDKLAKGDTDPLGKFIAAMSGKLYPFDEEKSRRSIQYSTQDREKNIKRMLRQARRKGDSAEEDRLMKTLDQARAEAAARLQ